MPRHHRSIGPRAKIDVAALRNLSRETRLARLIEAVAECGGTPDSTNGSTFRKRLAHIRQQNRRAG